MSEIQSVADESDPGEASAGGAVMRRGLIAGAVAAATAVVVGERTTQAANGGPFLLGDSNIATNPTVLTNTTTTSAIGLRVYATAASNGTAVEGNGSAYGVQGNSDGFAGVFGRTPGSSSVGVSGYHANASGDGVGVRGSSDSPSGAGVHGSAAGIGVYAAGGSFPPNSRPDGIYGLYAWSSSVAGAFASAHAPLLLVRSPDVAGAPTTGDHLAGEFWVDSAGKLFYCTLDGTPGTWIELSAAITELPPPPEPVVIPKRPTLQFLSTPERFVDTRTGSGGVTGPIAPEQIRTFVLTGRVGESGDPGLRIPDDAIAVAGNVTVIGQPGTAGYLTLWPAGDRPTVSTVNWGPANPDNPVANSFQIGLAAVDGEHKGLRVFNKGACDYIIDITGYFVEI